LRPPFQAKAQGRPKVPTSREPRYKGGRNKHGLSSQEVELFGEGDVFAEIVFSVAGFCEELDVGEDAFIAGEGGLDVCGDVELADGQESCYFVGDLFEKRSFLVRQFVGQFEGFFIDDQVASLGKCGDDGSDDVLNVGSVGLFGVEAGRLWEHRGKIIGRGAGFQVKTGGGEADEVCENQAGNKGMRRRGIFWIRPVANSDQMRQEVNRSFLQESGVRNQESGGLESLREMVNFLGFCAGGR
jgi:hypothetical protein